MKKMSNVISLITTIAHQLETIYSDPLLCEQYAWWMVEAITGRNKTSLLTDSTFSLSQEHNNTLRAWLDELIIEKKPLQYIIGSVPFLNVDILVESPILIPRPETEEWCAQLIKQLQPIKNHPLRILDLCCGTGCIAIALAKAFPRATVYAADISPAAIALTQKNLRHNAITNVQCKQSDLFAGFDTHTKFDIIVSNPPYIAADEWDSLDDSVTAWEDRNALIADDQGLAIIKKIIMKAQQYLSYNASLVQHQIPQLVIEIGYQQGTAVKQLMQQYHYTDIAVHKDLEGKDRVVSGGISDVVIAKVID